MGQPTAGEPGEDDAGEYDLAPQPRAAAAAAPPGAVGNSPPGTPGVPSAPATGGGAGAPRALGYQTPAAPAPADPETIKSFWMPLWLLAGGVVIETAAAFVKGPNLQASLTILTVGLVARTALMLVGMLIAAKVRGFGLGPIRTAVFKLAATAVGPAAVATLVTPVLYYATLGVALPLPLIGGVSLGGLIAMAIQFVLYFALLGALFDLDESDTWYCIGVIFLIHLVVYFALVALRG